MPRNLANQGAITKKITGLKWSPLLLRRLMADRIGFAASHGSLALQSTRRHNRRLIGAKKWESHQGSPI
jgi:hypothetical protein